MRELDEEEQPVNDESPENTEEDEKILREVRSRYRYGMDYWRDSREERKIDLRYMCGDPWDPKDKKERVDNHRPAISHDELNQYVNQAINNLRQNPRGIKVEAEGNGANDQTAELRQDLIRTIEYRSRAQSAYLSAAQDMHEGSYGFFRISRKYVLDDPDPSDPRAFNQEIVIKRIPNPDSVIYDPDCKEADWSDAKWCFVLEPMAVEEFKRRFPHARKSDFTADDLRVAKDWVQDKTVLVAEYWKVEVTTHTIKRGKQKRTNETKRLVQYLTNGIEILEETEQPGSEIPIPSMIGMERYVDDGTGPRRVLFSLPRLAREPQMSLAYLCSQEMEEAGLSPKVPIIGYVGQFETDSDTWEVLNKVPRAFAQIDPIVDAATNTVLPLPQWRQFTPNFQEYEIAKDSARRAIQAAMGISPLPTAAQRNNEKSKIALDKIEAQEAIGSYHFTQGYERAITRAGRIVDSWIPVTYDTEREMGLQKVNDSRRLVKLNTDQPYLNGKGEVEHFPIGEETHDVTVSTGPSFQSQHDAIDKFLDNLVANMQTLPVPPQAAAKILSLAIQMKNLGPRGDEMAEIISPKDQNQAGQMQGMQQQLAQQGDAMAKLQAELQKLVLERQGKVIDNEYKTSIEKMKIEAQVAAAEISTKAQHLEERLKFVEDLWSQLHGQAHDAAMAAQGHEHNQILSDQSHGQALEQADQSAQNAQLQPQPGETNA